MMTAFQLLGVWTMLLAEGSGETAQIWGTCDNFLTVQRADGGGSYVDVTDSLSGDPDNWEVTKSVVLDNVDASTKLRISCRDNINIVAALIFSVQYEGNYYSTDGGNDNNGYYALESAGSGRTETVTPSYPSWHSTLEVAPYNAQWTWTCGVDADFSGCSAGDTEVYVFSFSTIICDLDNACSAILNGVSQNIFDNSEKINALEEAVARLQQSNAGLRARLQSLENDVGIEDTTPMVFNLGSGNLLMVVVLLLVTNVVLCAYLWMCGGRAGKKYQPVAYVSE